MDWYDRISTAWVKANPDKDYSVLPPLVRAQRVGLLLDNLQKNVTAPFDLTPADYSVLATLRRSGSPYRMVPSELYSVLERSSGGMTKILKRLEARKLISRTPMPGDGRSSYIQLTKKGRDIEKDMFESYLTISQRILGDIPKQKLDEIDRALETLLDHFENYYYR